MYYKLLFLVFSLFLFSCQETKIPETLDGEVWLLKNQVIHISDTTYVTDSNGNAKPKVATTEFPINTNREETWTFSNQSLEILTKMSSGNVTKINFKVENTPEGFILKNENEEDKVCKITARTSKVMILKSGGIITLERIQ